MATPTPKSQLFAYKLPSSQPAPAAPQSSAPAPAPAAPAPTLAKPYGYAAEKTASPLKASVQQAQARGATPETILGEIAAQSPHKSAVLQEAAKRGATPQQILDEVVRQN